MQQRFFPPIIPFPPSLVTSSFRFTMSNPTLTFNRVQSKANTEQLGSTTFPGAVCGHHRTNHSNGQRYERHQFTRRLRQASRCYKNCLPYAARNCLSSVFQHPKPALSQEKFGQKVQQLQLDQRQPISRAASGPSTPEQTKDIWFASPGVPSTQQTLATSLFHTVVNLQPVRPFVVLPAQLDIASSGAHLDSIL